MKPPLVALIGWNWEGHRPARFRSYCRALLELGCCVGALCPAPQGLKNDLRAQGAIAGDDDARIRFRPMSIPSGPRLLTGTWKKAALPHLLAAKVRRALADMERAFGRRADCVFFDSWRDDEIPLAARTVRALDRPWSALASGAETPFAPAELLGDPLLRGIALCDETAAPTLQRGLRAPVVVFPELIDETQEPAPPFAQQLRRFAKGAKLVLAIEHPGFDAGVCDLARLALDPQAKDLAFFFAGPPPWPAFSPDETALFARAINEAPAAWFHAHHVPEGAIYNGAVRAADVIFAADRTSSRDGTLLTKAALAQRPIIVGAGGLAAARVSEYRLGEIISDGRPETILAAIRRLTDDFPAWVERNRPRWAEYRAAHSHARLAGAFADLLGIASPQPA